MDAKESHQYTPISEPKRYMRKPRISSVMNQVTRIFTIISCDDEEVRNGTTWATIQDICNYLEDEAGTIFFPASHSQVFFPAFAESKVIPIT